MREADLIEPLLKQEKILVCRPEPSASELEQVLNSVGACAKAMPCIEIRKLELDGEAKSKMMELDRYRHVIVVSQHAASIGLEWIDQYWPQFPVQQQWHAIGRQTARQLPVEELSISLPNADLNTEQLLEQPVFTELKDQRVLILKGKNGRTLLEEQLRRRGASVDTLELYERTAPKYADSYLDSMLTAFDPEIFVALSAETLENLLAYCARIGFEARQKAFILSSQRVANIALEQGFHLTYVPDNLMPIDIIRCVTKIRRAG